MVTDVSTPNDITKINAYAFYDCKSIKNVVVGENVTSIGNSAFGYCSGLTNLTFRGRTLESVQGMANYPWGISNTSIIKVE